MEQAFRHFKLSDLDVRPIYHYTEPRVREHLLLCILTRTKVPKTVYNRRRTAHGNP